MLRLRKVFLGVAWVVLVGVACNQIGGIEQGQPLNCATIEQCAIKNTPCYVAVACTQGECIFKDEPDGAPVAEQTPGDCMTIVCDGAGNVKTVPSDIDIPADDGKPCTVEKCNKGSEEHEYQLHTGIRR